MDDGTASAMTSRIADVLASLANRLAVATWRSEIDTILPSLCAAVGMSAASLFELRLAAGRWNAELVSTWPVREQADPRHDRFGELSQRWVRALAEGRALPGDTEDVSWYVRRVLERSGHSGSVILPVIAGDKPWGFITLEGPHEVRRWTRTDLAVLAAIGSVIGAAIARERTDRDLRDAELRYQTLIEQIPAITYIDQPDADSPTGFRPVFVSPQAERILGYRPAEIEGNANLWIELLHPDDRERALAADAAHHATGDPLENEYRLLARDGRIVWVRDEARMVRDEFGDPMYSHGVLLDITEQKRADLRRRESEALLRAIVESEPECVTLVDRRGRVKIINPAGLRMVEAETPHDVEGRSLEDLVAPEHRDAIRSLVAATQRGEGRTLEVDVVGLRGTRRSMDSHAVPFRDVAGRIVGCLLIARDVTERNRTRAELARTRSELLKILAHELFTPLTVIQGAGLTMAEHGDALGPDQRRDLLEGVERASHRLRRLVAALAAAARLDDDEPALVREPVHVADVVSLAVHRFPLDSDRLNVRISKRRLEVMANLELATTALATVLDNALDMSAGPVEIEAAERSGWVTVTVLDHGHGIPPDRRDEIFELFTQVDSSLTRHHEGLGIGLYLARRIMDAHGGHIDVIERRGYGAVFELSFPGGRSPE
jgi:PAS domain S-box-containing protein